MIYFNDFELSEEIKKALSGLQYELPTKVQQEVIPLILEGKDVIVKSKTGSGKTASFGVPICEKIDWLKNKPQVLVLTPTRELCVQVKEDLTNMGRFKRIKVIPIFGKQSFQLQKTELKQKNHIVVGTPGRILDHIEKNTIVLNEIKYLVIDEADEMLHMGFIEQVEDIIKNLPSDRVTLLFSATMPDSIKELANQYMKNPMDVAIEEGNYEKSITHYQFKVEENEKLDILKSTIIITNPNSCIIFCKTKDTVDSIYQEFQKCKFPCERIHGGMEQEERLEAMNGFKKGKVRYLIATDVAQRGIDVEEMELVINYDCPRTKEEYVHRIGRTGRGGKNGVAYSFVTEKDEKRILEIEEYINATVIVKELPTREAVEEKQREFTRSLKDEPKIKILKSERLNKDIMKIHINGGKNKKFRTVHLVATICNLENVSALDIGIITILDRHSYVEILNGKGSEVLEYLNDATILNKKVKATIAIK